MAVGDTITVATGNGKDLTCVLNRITPDKVEARVVGISGSQGEPPCFIRLFQAIPKGDKTDLIVQKAVELGVSEIHLIRSERCIVRESAADKKKNDRYNRIAFEAAKQCGRGIVPKVMLPAGFSEAIASAAESGLAFICHETVSDRTLPGIFPEKPPSTISFFVGPEGGFSEKEAEAAASLGIIPVGLGKRILRAETAPMFVLSFISCRYEL